MQRCTLTLTPPLFTSPWRPCHPGARLPPGRRASGTPSLTTAFPGCVAVTFSPGSRVMRSRTPACLAAVGIRDDRVAGWKRKEGCGCECARKHRVRLKMLVKRLLAKRRIVYRIFNKVLIINILDLFIQYIIYIFI
jgi:hypothetical protein